MLNSNLNKLLEYRDRTRERERKKKGWNFKNL